jgi:hypothetical protein
MKKHRGTLGFVKPIPTNNNDTETMLVTQQWKNWVMSYVILSDSTKSMHRKVWNGGTPPS